MRSFISILTAGLVVTAVADVAIPAVLTPRCGSQEPSQELLDLHRLVANQTMSHLERRSANIQIDVYVHVIARSKTSEEYVRRSTIKKQMAVMNRSYKQAGISFRLKKTEYTINPAWARGDDHENMRISLRKGGKSDLNLYLVKTLSSDPGTLADCNYPQGGLDGYALAQDGCVIKAATMPGGSLRNFNQGKTIVHEIGHWFGLLHTFADFSCDSDSDFGGDLIADTPASSSSTQGCPKSRDSCPDQPGQDPIHNFMDYSYDECMSEFTPGQMDRMHAIYKQYRAEPKAETPKPKAKVPRRKTKGGKQAGN